MARRSTVRRVEELIFFEDSRSVHRPALQPADRRSRKRPRRDPPPPLPDGFGRDGSHRIHRLSRLGSYPAGCRVTRHANRARHSGGPRVRIRLPPAESPLRTVGSENPGFGVPGSASTLRITATASSGSKVSACSTQMIGAVASLRYLQALARQTDASHLLAAGYRQVQWLGPRTQ
jgi:hypothetical protein